MATQTNTGMTPELFTSYYDLRKMAVTAGYDGKPLDKLVSGWIENPPQSSRDITTPQPRAPRKPRGTKPANAANNATEGASLTGKYDPEILTIVGTGTANHDTILKALNAGRDKNEKIRSKTLTNALKRLTAAGLLSKGGQGWSLAQSAQVDRRLVEGDQQRAAA